MVLARVITLIGIADTDFRWTGALGDSLLLAEISEIFLSAHCCGVTLMRPPFHVAEPYHKFVALDCR